MTPFQKLVLRALRLIIADIHFRSEWGTDHPRTKEAEILIDNIAGAIK